MSAKTIIDKMVELFIGWKLPHGFFPDCYISFDREKALESPHSWPTGTNLLSAEQARAMLAHVAAPALTELSELKALIRKVHAAKGRHHTQLAMCDLFDAVGLENVRPAKPMVSGAKMDPPPLSVTLTPAQFNGAHDPLYSEAVALCLAYNKGSISLVQRQLRIGYNRAACMLEAMHKAGVVAPLPTGGYAIVPQVDRKKPDDSEGGSHD